MKENKLRRRARTVAAGFAPGLLAALPERIGRGLGAVVGRLAYHTIPRDRERALKNLSLVHPDWSSAEVTREALRVFEEIGRNAYDFARYPRLSPTKRQDLLQGAGVEHLRHAVRAGRGVVLVTGHLGSFELVGAYLSRLGFPFSAVARPVREPRLDRLLTEHRRLLGFTTISARGSLLGAARHLREGGVLGILMDQRIRRGGCVVSFLGQPTRVTDGPVRLARMTGALMVPVGIVRLADQRHRIRFLPPLTAGSDGATIRDDTQRLAHILGTLIAEAPAQWMWLHPRWEEKLVLSSNPEPAGAAGA